jgi:hypothetical protein
MSFGKRGAGNDGSRPRPPSQAPSDPVSSGGSSNVRLSVAGSGGGFDLRFMALALGVVLVAAGGAFAFTMIGAPSVKIRPVAEIVPGLTRDQVKAALAVEALPDKRGAVFMATLHKHFPAEHDRLLGQMADTAMRGGDRNSLAIDVNEWLAPFAMQNLSNLGRTGAAGFDFALDTGDEMLEYISSTAGGCTAQSMGKLETLLSDPNRILEEISFGSKGYELNIRTSTKLIVLAGAGRNAPEPAAELTPQDEAALQSALLSLMMDREVQTLMQAGMAAASGETNALSRADVSRIDICKIGHTAIDRLRKLPDDTKARVWGAGAKELRKMMSSGGFRMPAPGQLSMR